MTAHSKTKAGPITIACSLILGGVVLLLYNLGVISSLAWLWKLSPIMLVGIGLEYFLKRMQSRDPGTEVRFSGASLALILVLILASGTFYAATGIGRDAGAFLESMPWSWTGQHYTRTWESQPMEMAEGDRLVVDDPIGRIDLLPASGTQLTVRALIHSPEKGPARERADQASVEVARSGSQVFVRVPAERNSITYDLEIKVPPNLDISVKSGAGEVSAADLRGNLDVRGDTGKIELERIGGNISVQSESGLIRVFEPGGDVTGDTRLGSLELSSNRPLAGRYNLKTGTGRISFDIPAASDLVIKAVSNTGHISVSGFGQEPVMKGTGSTFDATLGSGRGQADLRVNAGSIRIGETTDMSDGVETGPEAGSIEINAR